MFTYGNRTRGNTKRIIEELCCKLIVWIISFGYRFRQILQLETQVLTRLTNKLRTCILVWSAIREFPNLPISVKGQSHQFFDDAKEPKIFIHRQIEDQGMHYTYRALSDVLHMIGSKGVKPAIIFWQRLEMQIKVLKSTREGNRIPLRCGVYIRIWYSLTSASAHLAFGSIITMIITTMKRDEQIVEWNALKIACALEKL